MLARAHVAPFTRERDGEVEVDFLADDPRVVAFLDRLCRLVRRLRDRPRGRVAEALRRQERRVRDQRRMAGIAKTLLDACRFQAPPGADQAPGVRRAVFLARGRRWPPLPGDGEEPYREAAAQLGIEPADARRLLFADRPAERTLARAPRFGGRRLLERYNLELARGVLFDATRVVLTAEGGWRDIFRSVKLARLMYRLERAGEGVYRLELTGPAAAFIERPLRYGRRFARVVPALARAPGWALEADVLSDGRPLRYRLDGRAPLGRRRRSRPGFDSAWERSLAGEFEAKVGAERGGWTLRREATPLSAGGELFLPDFTLVHDDGREALVEVVGFWTPGYLEAKLRKVRTAGLEHLVLVVYRGLAVGAKAGAGPAEVAPDGPPAVREPAGAYGQGAHPADPALPGEAPPGPVLWFTHKPRIGPVMEAVERVARRP